MRQPNTSAPVVRRQIAVIVALAVCLACAAPDGSGDRGETPPDDPADPPAAVAHAPLVELLENGEALFGIFSGEKTPEQGALMAENRELDFVFYSLEQGPFDLETMAAYRGGMDDAAAAMGAPSHPVALRIPPIRDGHDQAREKTRLALAAGVDAVVFPHVTTGAEAALAVEAMGAQHWPGNPDGSLVSMLIVEDREGVENVDEVMGTAGVSVVFAGPGDLRRAYEGAMEAVESAIQTVLASCVAHDVPCGITAGAADVSKRIEQGFRVIIVTEAEALAPGRAAAGRTS